METKRFVVQCWFRNSHGEWWFSDIAKAREVRSELLATLPAGWDITLREVEDGKC